MNWKTSLMGLLTIVSAVSAAMLAALDNDPMTNPNWAVVASAFTSGLGLLLAKDSK